ncbi:MAG: cobyrinate a,c-diamide synthase, partial [Pseudomonadota bacterium]
NNTEKRDFRPKRSKPRRRQGRRRPGFVLNRVASARHLALAKAGLNRADVPLLGHLPRDPALLLPERHLGLVQADEQPSLAAAIATAAGHLAAHLDLGKLSAAAGPLAAGANALCLPPLGQRIAVASDIAFSFTYPHFLDDWRAAGAEILPFSPLKDEGPDPCADAVYLPGGYPELHAGRLAAAKRFCAGLRAAADGGALIYGECGGYMVLGKGLEDADGARHQMLGLLPLETSFRTRRRTLGYRKLTAKPGAPWAGRLMAHEFHYATVTHAGAVPPIFEATDADGVPIPPMGQTVGRIAGSFAHVIAPAAR